MDENKPKEENNDVKIDTDNIKMDEKQETKETELIEVNEDSQSQSV